MRGKKPDPPVRTPVHPGPVQKFRRQHQPDLFISFAQGADLGAFIPLPAPARQIPMPGIGNIRLVIALDDKQILPQKQRQLRAGKFFVC